MSHIAVITGAGRGLGRAVAERLARKAYRVLVTDIDGDAAARTAAALGNGAWAEKQDVRDPNSHRAIARAATQRGDVKAWINNAGVLAVGKTWDIADGRRPPHGRTVATTARRDGKVRSLAPQIAGPRTSCGLPLPARAH